MITYSTYYLSKIINCDGLQVIIIPLSIHSCQQFTAASLSACFPIDASRPLLPAPARIPDLIHRSQSARPDLRTAIHYYKSAPLKPWQPQATPCQCETESWLLASTLTEFVSFAVSPAEHHGLLCASLYSCCPSVNALQP